MIINSIEPIVVHVNHRGDWIFVLIHTDTEITGLGETSHSRNDALLLSVLESFAQRLVGRDPRQIEASLSSIFFDLYWVKYSASRRNHVSG